MSWQTKRRVCGLAITASFALLLPSCGCGTPSDDERVLEAIDTTAVHLYLALKILIAEPDRDADVKRASKLLDTAIAAMDSHKPGKPAGLRPQDALAVGSALWALRGLGQAEVALGRNSKLKPLLAELAEQKTGAKLDAASDHALLLLGMMLAKLHPDSPSPVPSSLLLYEAWMTGEQPLSIAPLEPLARSAQAYAYASSELCDLAKQDTDLLAQPRNQLDQGDKQALLDGLSGLGRFAAHGSPDVTFTIVFVATVPWWARIAAHLTTARCLDGRERTQDATLEWKRAVDVAAQAGFPEVDLALVRAYLAHRQGDAKELHAQLVVARGSHLLDAQAKKDLDALIEHYDPSNQDAVTRFFNPVFLGSFVLKMSYQRAQQAGLFEALAHMPVFEQARGILGSLDQAAEPARSGFSKLKGWLQGALKP